MDAKAVVVAAITCTIIAVALTVGAVASAGMTPRLVYVTGIGAGVLAGGLFAGARLYARIDRLERVLSGHIRHDRDALNEATQISGDDSVHRMH